MRPGIRVVLAAIACGVALSALAAEPTRCRLARVAEWPVRFPHGLPVIDGAINGRNVGILPDTGAFASMLTNDTAEKLGLFTAGTSQFMQGVGGLSRVRETRIDELRIGDAAHKGMAVRVGGERPIPGVDFILGDDFFRQMEVEFDYAKGVIRLFQARDCRNAFLAYWDADALELPMERGDHVFVGVKLNGRAAQAMLDSGASHTFVSLALAQKAGFDPEASGAKATGCASGVGAGSMRSWVARFDSIEIGDEKIRDVELSVGNYWAEIGRDGNVPELLLGTDFLRAHRVLVSRSQRKVYFSYVGGKVFPAAPARECREGKATQETPQQR